MATLLRIPHRGGSSAPQRVSGINWASPLARDLAFAWTLQGPRGLHDLCGRADLTVQAGTPTVEIFHAIQSQAYECVGQNAALGISAADWDAQGLRDDVTISMWVSPTSGRSNGSSYFGTYQSSARDADSITGFCLMDTGSLIRMRAVIGGSNNILDGPTWAAGDEHHLILARSGANAYIAVDGSVVASTSSWGTGQIDSWPFYVGTVSAFNTSREAALRASHVRVYSRYLPTTEVAEHYHPRSRWDIYDQGKRTYFIPAAAAPAGSTFKPPSGLSLLGVGV